jgi:hypothetical protein
VLTALDGVLFRSMTTNGLLLERHLDALVTARPDKVHVSIHFPEDAREVERVISQVHLLHSRGIRSGINLLVERSKLTAATATAQRIAAADIAPDRVMFLPRRGSDTPSPRELAGVAGVRHFQSKTCLLGCAKSPRFASIAWDRTVAWCSYTTSRRALPSLDHAGLLRALDGLDLAFCGVAA